MTPENRHMRRRPTLCNRMVATAFTSRGLQNESIDRDCYSSSTNTRY